MEWLWFGKRSSAFTFCVVFVSVTLILESEAMLLKRTREKEHGSTTGRLLDTKVREFAYKSIRIPKNIRPLHYDLFLHPNLTSLKYDGKLTISLKCFEVTNRIIFHMKDLKMDQIKVVNEGKTEIKVKDVSENKERNLVILELDEKLEKDKEYYLSMDFSGKLSDNMEGFYKSEYTTKSGEKRSVRCIYSYCLFVQRFPRLFFS